MFFLDSQVELTVVRKVVTANCNCRLELSSVDENCSFWFTEVFLRGIGIDDQNNLFHQLTTTSADLRLGSDSFPDCSTNTDYTEVPLQKAYYQRQNVRQKSFRDRTLMPFFSWKELINSFLLMRHILMFSDFFELFSPIGRTRCCSCV